MKKILLCTLAIVLMTGAVTAKSVQPVKTTAIKKLSIPPINAVYLKGINCKEQCDSIKINLKGVNQTTFSRVSFTATTDQSRTKKSQGIPSV
ncbi:MAG: hypothetical protein V2A54_04975 [Bacteroidota bacterium]